MYMVTGGGPEMARSVAKQSKRDIQAAVFSSSPDSVVSLYSTSERLTLIIPNNYFNGCRTTELFITIFARKDSKFFFEYMQRALKLNFEVFFGVLFSSITLISCLATAILKMIQVIKNWQQEIQNRHLRERRAYRPIASITLYFHSGIEAENLISICPDEKKLDIEVLDDGYSKLSSSSSLALKRKKRHKKERGSSKVGEKSVEEVDRSEIAIWPVTMQATADQVASVYSVIVQLPSRKSSSHILCVGSSLVHHTEVVDDEDDQTSSASRLTRRLKRSRLQAATTLSSTAEDNTSPAVVTSQL